MPASQTFIDVVTKGMNVVHKSVLKVSGGRLGWDMGGMAAVELHTTGQRSGQRRSVMLTAPILDDDHVVLIASNGGDDRHPDWYHNLVADPKVEITRHGETTKMVARTASVEEKAELWPTIVAAYKGYAGYQKRTERDIPVVICRPLS